MSYTRTTFLVVLVLTGSSLAQTLPSDIPPLPDETTSTLEGIETPEALTLDALQAMGEKHNPTLVQAIMQIEGVRGKALQAGLWPNPTVGYQADQMGIEGTAGEFQGGFIQQEIVTAKKLQLSRRKYLARANVAELNALIQSFRVKNSICIQFYRVLGAGEVVSIERELLETAEDNLVTRKEMFNIGQANEAEVLQARVELQQQQLRVKMAQNSYQQEWATLSAVVGVPQLRAPLTGVLDAQGNLIDWEPALERLLAESPEIRAAHAKLRGDEITLQRERAEPIPNIVVQGGAGYNFETGDDVYGASVSIKVPLFDRNQGTIRQAQADLARQQAEIRRLELALQQRLGMEYRHYLNAYQKVQGFRNVILPNSRKAYEVMLRSYKENRAPWPDVLQHQHTYFERRREYIEQLVALREAEIGINGLLLKGGLQVPIGIIPPGHIDAVPKPR